MERLDESMAGSNGILSGVCTHGIEVPAGKLMTQISRSHCSLNHLRVVVFDTAPLHRNLSRIWYVGYTLNVVLKGWRQYNMLIFCAYITILPIFSLLY